MDFTGLGWCGLAIKGKTSWFQSSPCSSQAHCSASTAIWSSANTRSVKRRMNGQARLRAPGIGGFSIMSRP
jgi:hypothetical protein